jgi:adenylate kinase family enzyme
MTDYTKTKIYKIESHLGDKIYVGSTAKNYLSQRLQQHKVGYKLWKEGKINKTTSYDIFDEYGVENCIITLIESCPCTCKDEKNKKESYYIRELECVNKVIPNRTRKQRDEDKKEIITQQHKDYYIKNKEKISEKKKLYYQLKKNKKLEEENIINQ